MNTKDNVAIIEVIPLKAKIDKIKKETAWDIFKLLSNRDEYNINHLPREEMNKKYKEIKSLINEYLESDRVDIN